MPTENDAKVKEVGKIVLNSVTIKLPSLGFYKLYKGMRFLWGFFVCLFLGFFLFLTQFCMWWNDFLVCHNFYFC